MEFIYERENFIPSEVCTRIIDKFEKSDNKRNGTTTKGLDTGYKRSTEIRLYGNGHWDDELNYFDEVLERARNEYRIHIKPLDRNGLLDAVLRDSHVYPPQIQRTLPGEFYHWHSDANMVRRTRRHPRRRRAITFTGTYFPNSTHALTVCPP